MIDPDNPHLTAQTDDLIVSYEARGPENGRPVLLLHGWPDSIRTWDALVKAGCRTIVPYLRGFGETRFRDAATPRTAQAVALATDAVQLLDALGIERATVVGHDWGGRAAYPLAALWPERVERLITLSVAYQTNVTPGSRLDYHQQQAYWYQWFFASERAREALQDNRRNLCRYLWQVWAPTWAFTEEEFTRAADAWLNPDWVDITLHAYRVRWGNALPDPRYATREAQLKEHPPITVPTVVLHGERDGASLVASTAEQAPSFRGGYRREVLPNIGHFIPRECPEAVIRTVLDQG